MYQDVLPSWETTFVKYLHYGDDSFDLLASTLTLNASAEYILQVKDLMVDFYMIFFVYASFCKVTANHFLLSLLVYFILGAPNLSTRQL